MEKNFCFYYLCLHQAKLSLDNKLFENIIFNDIPGIGISQLLMNIMSCHGNVKVKKSTVISSCRRQSVYHHLSKGFVIPEKKFKCHDRCASPCEKNNKFINLT